MDHQYVMQHHHHQHHRPVQAHDLPQRSPRRPNTPSRGHADGGGHDNQHHGHGHIMQSRTSSQAHVITNREKRSRSRSRGRRRRERQQGRVAADGRRESSFNESGGSRFNDSAYSQEGKINEFGRCVRHPTIELCVRDPATYEWRVLLQDCPLCSLHGSGLDLLQGGGAAAMRINDGGGSSQTTPSTKTNRTMTTEEESSVKSWTLSDASTSECESVSGRTAASTMEHLFKPQRPPPPSGPRPRTASNIYAGTHQNHYNQGNIQANQSFNSQDQSFDPVQSLKELGQKLVMESEQPAVRCPPPPPKRPPPPGARSQRENAKGEEAFRRKESAASSVGSQRHGRTARPPPRRSEAAASIAAQKALAAVAGAEAMGGGESSENILGEASDVIAQMESVTEWEARGDASAVGSARRGARRQQQQQEQKQMELLNQMMGTGEERIVGDDGDVGNDDPIATRIAAAEAAALEKRARAQRRREKAERKAARQRAREARQGNGDEDGRTYTLPMKDGGVERGRGQEGRSTDDILQAAAQIRARARRSTSRSRERVKEASLFCGENPKEDDGGRDDEIDHMSLTSEKRRSILNPHGLEEQPRAPVVERRSQSREKRGRRSRTLSGGGLDVDQVESSNKGKRKAGRGSRGRNRNSTEDYKDMLNSQQTTAEELLSRRREMRQKIAERQQNAQSRNDHRRSGSGPGDLAVDDHMSHLSLKEEVLEAWSGDATASRRPSRRDGDRSEGPRRSRSRSVVRDGISKIRSSSLFRKRGERGGGAPEGGGGDAWDADRPSPVEDCKTSHGSVDSAKRSTSSFRRLLSRGKARSRSRGRSSASSGGGSDLQGWPASSETFGNHERGLGEFDNRSACAKSELYGGGGSKQSSVSRSSFGVFKRSKSRGKNRPKSSKVGGGMGMVRSLSRGSFRSNRNDDDDRDLRHTQYGQSYDHEIGSMHSTSSGKPARTRGFSRDDFL